VVRLLWMVKLVSLLPPSVSRLLARLLNAPRRPFDVLNYLAPCIGARLLDPTRMVRLMDRGTASLAARLAREPDERLAQGMHYPTRWEPFFEDYLTVAQTYEYPTKHYDFHRAQLNLTPQTR